MELNIFRFKLSQMMKYSDMYKEKGDALNWAKILELNEHSTPIISIYVMDDNDKNKELAYAVWSWKNEYRELKFGKVEVKVKSLKKLGIGTTLMKMVIAIAKHNNARTISGEIAGEKYLWHWYANLGFTIHDVNKIRMDLS